jgi:hypothetical protein
MIRWKESIDDALEEFKAMFHTGMVQTLHIPKICGIFSRRIYRSKHPKEHIYPYFYTTSNPSDLEYARTGPFAVTLIRRCFTTQIKI